VVIFSGPLKGVEEDWWPPLGFIVLLLDPTVFWGEKEKGIFEADRSEYCSPFATHGAGFKAERLLTDPKGTST